MALPTSGPLALTQIQTEFGGANPIGLNEYYKGGAYVLASDIAPNIPVSGALAISNFHGAAKVPVLDFIVVGAGASGGDFSGGGSGAVITKNAHAFPTGSLTLTIGAGGVYSPVSNRLDNDSGTRVYYTCNNWGATGGTSSIGSIASAGGGVAPTASSVGGVTGSAITVPSGATAYSNTAGTAGQRGGCGAVSDGTGTYVGGVGVSITLGGVFTFNLACGGGAGQYWNVSGATTSAGLGGAVGGQQCGGSSGRIAGNRDAGVSPDAGTGYPPNNQGTVYATSSYWKGENGYALSVSGATYNTGSGGGGAARAEVVYGDGCHGVYAGSGSAGLIVLGYNSASGAKAYGGTVINSGTYYAHIFVSTTVITL